MAKRELDDRLSIVAVVTRKHGEKFAEKWREESTDSGAMVEAFARTGVVRWPDSRAAQERFHDIEDEVTERVLDELRDVVVDAFVRIAGEVLARERGRGRPRKSILDLTGDHET